MKTIYKICCLSIILLTLMGCMSNNEPEIYTAKSWEGHYYTADEFLKSTSNIQLEKNESVWVLSNRSLKRVLENLKETK